MTRLQDIVRASKVDIKIGSWHNGKVPRADFPIAKKAYGLGKSFQWCVISFAALGFECRVLVVLNAPKEKYEAILGVLADGQMRILSSYEFHAGEPGWHCHASCGDVAEVPKGFMRGPWVRRIPRAHRTHTRQDFGIDGQQNKVETKGSLL